MPSSIVAILTFAFIFAYYALFGAPRSGVLHFKGVVPKRLHIPDFARLRALLCVVRMASSSAMSVDSAAVAVAHAESVVVPKSSSLAVVAAEPNAAGSTSAAMNCGKDGKEQKQQNAVRLNRFAACRRTA
jgi:hypothetical protein